MNNFNYIDCCLIEHFIHNVKDRNDKGGNLDDFKVALDKLEKNKWGQITVVSNISEICDLISFIQSFFGLLAIRNTKEYMDGVNSHQHLIARM